MTFNYQIMEPDKNGKYNPDYEKLIANSSCKEEAQKWKEAQELRELCPGFGGFTFNMVVCMKQKCGHWEIFQSPINEFYKLDETLELMHNESMNRDCTRCICGW